jgi:hypothetical protein
MSPQNIFYGKFYISIRFNYSFINSTFLSAFMYLLIAIYYIIITINSLFKFSIFLFYLYLLVLYIYILYQINNQLFFYIISYLFYLHQLIINIIIKSFCLIYLQNGLTIINIIYFF